MIFFVKICHGAKFSQWFNIFCLFSYYSMHVCLLLGLGSTLGRSKLGNCPAGAPAICKSLMVMQIWTWNGSVPILDKLDVKGMPVVHDTIWFNSKVILHHGSKSAYQDLLFPKTTIYKPGFHVYSTFEENKADPTTVALTKVWKTHHLCNKITDFNIDCTSMLEMASQVRTRC